MQEQDRLFARVAILEEMEVDVAAAGEIDADQLARERKLGFDPRRQRRSGIAARAGQLGSRKAPRSAATRSGRSQFGQWPVSA